MIVNKVMLAEVINIAKATLNFSDNCIQEISTGELVQDSTLIKLDHVSNDVFKKTDLDDVAEILSSIDYEILATMFPLDEPVKLYKHNIQNASVNFVNNNIPIYLNTGNEIYVEIENIYNISNIELYLIQGAREFSQWKSIVSIGTRNQNETLHITNAMPSHLYKSWYLRYYSSNNPPC